MQDECVAFMSITSALKRATAFVCHKIGNTQTQKLILCIIQWKTVSTIFYSTEFIIIYNQQPLRTQVKSNLNVQSNVYQHVYF